MWPFTNRRKANVVGVFDPGEAGVYRYKAGKDRWVDADPMDLIHRLSERADALSAAMQLARSKVVAKIGNAKFRAEQERAYEEVMDHVRYIFDLKPFSEGGLSQVQAMMLFNHFTEWTEALKKNSGPTATSAEETSTATPPSTSPSAGSGRPTSTTSASGLTDLVLNDGPPTPSTSPPSPHLESPTQAQASGQTSPTPSSRPRS